MLSILWSLSDVEFPRYSFSQEKPTDFILFTDASQQAYGYVLYAKQENISNFSAVYQHELHLSTSKAHLLAKPDFLFTCISGRIN